MRGVRSKRSSGLWGALVHLAVRTKLLVNSVDPYVYDAIGGEQPDLHESLGRKERDTSDDRTGLVSARNDTRQRRCATTGALYPRTMSADDFRPPRTDPQSTPTAPGTRRGLRGPARGVRAEA